MMQQHEEEEETCKRIRRRGNKNIGMQWSFCLIVSVIISHVCLNTVGNEQAWFTLVDASSESSSCAFAWHFVPPKLRQQSSAIYGTASPNEEHKEKEDNEGDKVRAAKAAAAAKLLLQHRQRRGGAIPKEATPSKGTSVGERRIKSASLARSAASTSTKSSSLLNAAIAARKLQSKDSKDSLQACFNPSTSSIQSAIKNTFSSQRQSWALSPNSPYSNNESTSTMGLLGDRQALYNYNPSHSKPPPGTILICPKTSYPPPKNKSKNLPQTIKNSIVIRTATPNDDRYIANLRLSVFSDFGADTQTRNKYTSQSVSVLASRRSQGATCLVAYFPKKRNEELYYEHVIPFRVRSRELHAPPSFHRQTTTDGCNNNVVVDARQDFDDISSFSSSRSLKQTMSNSLFAEMCASTSSSSPLSLPSPSSTTTSSTTSREAQIEQEEGDIEWILGSLECSSHEFVNTELGRKRPISKVLYLTEVAVSPEARRCGAGTLLLQGVDKLAATRKIESIYLHVDVTNQAALDLYQKSGYQLLDRRPNAYNVDAYMYEEFTYKLNLHDGYIKGRCHYLMVKHYVKNPTWLDESESESSSSGFVWGEEEKLEEDYGDRRRRNNDGNVENKEESRRLFDFVWGEEEKLEEDYGDRRRRNNDGNVENKEESRRLFDFVWGEEEKLEEDYGDRRRRNNNGNAENKEGSRRSFGFEIGSFI